MEHGADQVRADEVQVAGLLLGILDAPPNPNERNALHLDREIDARLALPSEDNPSPASGRPDQP